MCLCRCCFVVVVVLKFIGLYNAGVILIVSLVLMSRVTAAFTGYAPRPTARLSVRCSVTCAVAAGR